MLTAFAPQPVVELKQRDKSKIEAILAYGDRLLVGLNTGHLRVYRFNETQNSPGTNNGDQQNAPDQPKSRLVELLREEEKFSKKPIQQLAIIKEASILISLSDGYVSFYDLQTYTLSERLDKTKGASMFAVTSNIVKDANNGIPSIVSRLAVAVKRKLVVWTWRDMENTGAAEEISLVASVKSLVWSSGTKLVVGLDPGFVIVDVETREVADVNRITGPGEPGAGAGTRFGAVNVSGIGYVGMGSWVPKPMATRLSAGRLLLARDVNTLFTDDNGNPTEKRQIPWHAAPEAIGYSYPYMLALQQPMRGGLEIRNPDTLTLLQTISLPSATLLHVPQPYISLAHAGKGFLVASERVIWRMGAKGYTTQIEELLSRSHFDEAISLVDMLEDTLFLDKDARLRDIRILKAHWLFGQQKYRDAFDLFTSAQATPANVVGLFPASIAGRISSDQKGDDPPESGGGIDSRSVHEEKASTAQPALEGRDLTLAVNELRLFLAQTRTQLQKFINYDGTLKEGAYESRFAYEHLLSSAYQSSDDCRRSLLETATLVDTTLFRAYMLVSPSLAGSLFRLENFCVPDVVEEKLYENGRYADLIDFLHGKRLHNEALDMLQKFGKGEENLQVSDGFKGPERTVRYLQQLPSEMIDLILQYAAWPLREKPDLAIEIFMADTENAESLPRDKVVRFLDGINVTLSLKYLEHIVKELDDQTQAFHERLIGLYLDKLKQASSDSAGPGVANARHWKDTLERFLQRSQQYNKTRVLRELPQSDPNFYESRAIILSKLGQHKQALEIYVYQMQDYKKAEEYCNQLYLSMTKSESTLDPDSPEQTESVYTTLLSLYLGRPRGLDANLPAALDLLSRHGSRLPALNTLSILPTQLPVKDLESYFRGRMRAANSLTREVAVIAAISMVEKTDWEGALLIGEGPNAVVSNSSSVEKARNRRIVIGENRLCGICGRRFGSKTAVRAYPDGAVVHYGCSDRRERGSYAGR